MVSWSPYTLGSIPDADLVHLLTTSAYQASDKPRYYKANKGLIGLICFNLVIL